MAAAAAQKQAAAAVTYQRAGDSAWASIEKVNSELLTLTYGAMVTTLLKDYKDVKVVNAELEKIGYNIGVRLIDEFLAKSGVKACANFRETAQAIAKVAFKMFLGITADVTNWRDDNKQFSLVFRGNPLFDFVELPAHLAGGTTATAPASAAAGGSAAGAAAAEPPLQYGNILCGVIRGALQMIQLVVDCQYVKSELTGSAESEIRVTLKEILQEAPVDEDE